MSPLRGFWDLLVYCIYKHSTAARLIHFPAFAHHIVAFSIYAFWMIYDSRVVKE